MALKPKLKVKKANTLANKTDDNVYEGVISVAEFATATKRQRNGREVEDISYECFKLECEFVGTNEPIRIGVQTGLNINDEPVDTINKGRGAKNEVKIYNRFTTLLLRLNILKEEDLKNIDDAKLEQVEKDVESLKGQMIKCKIAKDKSNFYVIDLSTLELKS